MNAYPSWIHRIPEMIEALALAGVERIDRQWAERLFDSARYRCQGAAPMHGRGIVGPLAGDQPQPADGPVARALENPDWKWEAQRRRTVRDRLEVSTAAT